MEHNLKPKAQYKDTWAIHSAYCGDVKGDNSFSLRDTVVSVWAALGVCGEISLAFWAENTSVWSANKSSQNTVQRKDSRIKTSHKLAEWKNVFICRHFSFFSLVTFKKAFLSGGKDNFIKEKKITEDDQTRLGAVKATIWFSLACQVRLGIWVTLTQWLFGVTLVSCASAKKWRQGGEYSTRRKIKITPKN